MPITRRFASTLVALLAVAHCTHAGGPKIPGIGPAGDVVLVKGGFEFTEGPASDGKGNLYFTDIPANRIYKLDAQNQVSAFLEPSNHCNGLMFDGKGRLLACEMDGRLVAIEVASKQVTPLAAEYEGKRVCESFFRDAGTGELSTVVTIDGERSPELESHYRVLQPEERIHLRQLDESVDPERQDV